MSECNICGPDCACDHVHCDELSAAIADLDDLGRRMTALANEWERKAQIVPFENPGRTARCGTLHEVAAELREALMMGTACPMCYGAGSAAPTREDGR
jgi:hypothetical protein